MNSTSRKLVRMRPLKPSELPAHPDLAALQPSPPTFETFVHDVLAEAESFMVEYLPQNFKVKSRDKSSPPSTAPVELLSHDVPASADGNPAEAWFARTSIHANAAEPGTASWEEFDAGLRRNHSRNEKEYTPDVYDAHQALEWSAPGGQRTIADWEDVEVKLMEMVHQIPTPLNDRVFAELVITAVKKSREEFLVVQIPVDTSEVPAAKHPRGREGKGKTTGVYCSIERGQLVEAGKRVKWQMGTASDAGGVLPMSLQKLGVGPAVVKDVGLFLSWSAEQRVKK